ncbi:MAG TPA: uroporphyrinogen decarboxylase family protein [Phycisphaerae bacterium]|nr:uroporphyrinogen decarboxylase family protein [Phycisphaerae bacterium]
MDVNALINRYDRLKARRGPKLKRFVDGEQPFLVIQRPGGSRLWHDCNSVEHVVKNNWETFAANLDFEFTDELPYLEPWIGVGVFANAFGCNYVWREGEAPATHYRYSELAEVAELEQPDWRKSPVMRMVLEVIDAINARSSGRLPISLTDTQSPFDTATLIVDATNFMIGCYDTPELAKRFLGQVTDTIIAFSKVQYEHIGPCAMRPGHGMYGNPFGRGIALSDDNLSFCDAAFARTFAIAFNQRLGEAFGGVAIHSCGAWPHVMRQLKDFSQVFMIDCALSMDCDPSPCSPAAVRDALKGSGIIVKVRVGNDLPKTLSMLEELADPTLQLVVEIGYSETYAEDHYRTVTEKLGKLYGIS